MPWMWRVRELKMKGYVFLSWTITQERKREVVLPLISQFATHFWSRQYGPNSRVLCSLLNEEYKVQSKEVILVVCIVDCIVERVYLTHVIWKYINTYCYMRFRSLVVRLILLALLVAVIGTGYIFVATIIFKDTSYAGFYNSWQFPMLLAIFIDAAYYKHISRMS